MVDFLKYKAAYQAGLELITWFDGSLLELYLNRTGERKYEAREVVLDVRTYGYNYGDGCGCVETVSKARVRA